jgi:hypothetical protein
LKQETQLYKTDQEFIKGSPSAYAAAKNLGVIDIVFQNLERKSKKRVPPNFWNLETVTQEALKYDRRVDFMKHSKGAYLKAIENGWLDEVTKHMVEPVTVKSNTRKFIEKARKVHGEKYDYSKTNYTKSNEPVIIICPEHGEFSQIATHHVAGSGCFECSLVKRSENNPYKKTKEEFLLNAQNLYGDKYDYSLVDYKNKNTDVDIICPKHGVFKQTPHQHINMGQGCQKCGWERSSEKQKDSKEDFIRKANAVHNGKFDYSKVKYEKSSVPVNIICPEHGEFSQRPVDHLNGQGCPICKESKGEKLVRSILFKNDIPFESQKKFIDCTNNKKGTSCRRLPFDFYLPTMNAVIEFDGAQHYRPVKIFGGVDAFTKRRILDMIKNQYCKDKGIKMIRVLDTLRKEDIESYILKELGL